MEVSRQKWIALVLVSMAIFLCVIDLFIVNVAIPTIKIALNASDADSQLVVVLYVIGYAGFLIAGSKAGDYFGRKKVYLIGMLIFTLASALCSISQTALQLNLSRLLQGISAAFMVPQGLALIPLIFANNADKVKAYGIYGSIAGVASVIGQFLGGLLPDIHTFIEGWRMIFVINIPVGLIAIYWGYKLLPESERQNRLSFDFVGQTLLLFLLVGFIYPLIEGREKNWPLWSLVVLGLSGILALVFIAHQRYRKQQGKSVLIDIKVFAFADFNLGLAAVILYFMVQDTYFFINAMYLQNGLAISSTQTGYYFVFQGLGYVLASVIAVKLLDKLQEKLIVIGVMIMVFSLSAHLYVFSTSEIHPILVYGILFIYGLGCGTVLPCMLTVAIRHIPDDLVGAASGVYLTVQQLAIALGIALIVGLFFNRIESASYFIAYQTVTWFNVILLLGVGVMFAFKIRKNMAK
ncbi:MFS transporter [Flavobacterium sp. HSC-61S13]|uniref:MFS transporter n=1 Tax=Flavobacterium sp. HSC-61S13 TaxID=2910963 RepID=UPI00209D16E1|nr:MFS transporter [Flavobacterium sp. HSC-61S13]MCP1994643.1 EmrB/QacA subfamily drug resistance transporter [Flavobacterium sp. HSC-61S13]